VEGDGDALEGADCAARAPEAVSSHANAKDAAMVCLLTKVVALFFDDREFVSCLGIGPFL